MSDSPAERPAAAKEAGQGHDSGSAVEGCSGRGRTANQWLLWIHAGRLTYFLVRGLWGDVCSIIINFLLLYVIL